MIQLLTLPYFCGGSDRLVPFSINLCVQVGDSSGGFFQDVLSRAHPMIMVMTGAQASCMCQGYSWF